MKCLLAAAAIALISNTASAAPVCTDDINALTTALREKYNEYEVFFGGPSVLGFDYRVFASAAGSWSIIRESQHNGVPIACVMATGRGGKIAAAI